MRPDPVGIGGDRHIQRRWAAKNRIATRSELAAAVIPRIKRGSINGNDRRVSVFNRHLRCSNRRNSINSSRVDRDQKGSQSDCAGPGSLRSCPSANRIRSSRDRSSGRLARFRSWRGSFEEVVELGRLVDAFDENSVIGDQRIDLDHILGSKALSPQAWVFELG